MHEFKVEAMSCGHCVDVVTRTVKSVDPAAQVRVDLASKEVKVESSKERAFIAGALAEAGYEAR